MDLNRFLLVFHIQWCMKYLLEEINPNPDPKTTITPYPQSKTTDRYIQAIGPHPHVSITCNPLKKKRAKRLILPLMSMSYPPNTADRHIQTFSGYPLSRLADQHIRTLRRYPHVPITRNPLSRPAD